MKYLSCLSVQPIQTSLSVHLMAYTTVLVIYCMGSLLSVIPANQSTKAKGYEILFDVVHYNFKIRCINQKIWILHIHSHLCYIRCSDPRQVPFGMSVCF